MTLPTAMPHSNQLGANSTGGAGRVAFSLGDETALRLERALLSDDRSQSLVELVAALETDVLFSQWVLRLAEKRLGRTVNRPEDAAGWLNDRLEIELAAALEGESNDRRGDSATSRLAALARRLSQYEQRLGDFAQRLEREKLESLKELAYGASHEINNPLANIAARAQMLLVDEIDPERRRMLSAIHRQAMRAHEMIADLMLFARPPKLKRQICDLGALVRDVVEQLGELARERNAEILFEQRGESIQLSIDATQIGVAVHALVVNSLEAVDDGGQVWVSVRVVDADGKAWAEIVVRDDGPGISDEVRLHIFDPFFSGREAGRGLGFGLSKCWRLVTDHGGELVVHRPAGGGAEIAIRLPMSADAVQVV